MSSKLQQISAIIRARTILNSHRAGTPHLASCLSCVDILVYLFESCLTFYPDHPDHPDRDRFILSKGHAAPVLFQVLAEYKFFPKSWLDDYGKDGTFFGEHPFAKGVPGIEAATGSLGHGLPIGVGIALAGKLQQKNYKTVVLLGDGECNEGTVWEAAMFAPVHNLHNLIVVVDYNKWQATARSQETLKLESLSAKFAAFGWNAVEIDGHNFEQLEESLQKAYQNTSAPTAIIAHTVKGKGVSFMEDDNNWHYRKPKADEVEASYVELGISDRSLI